MAPELNRVFFCLALLALPACAGGVDLDGMQVDETLKTSAVSSTPAPSDATRQSDMMTIRNAVSSADPKAVGTEGIPWANVDTGSRGAITGMVEYRRQGLLCRKFKASRESFDGVGLFEGDTCRVTDGSWQMLAFTAA